MNKKCLWCGSEIANTKEGWVPFHFHNKNVPEIIFFCSKKHLAAATYQGKGLCLDINKIAKNQRNINKKKESAQMAEIMQKEKLDKKDMQQLFLCLTAKQKKALALIGLVYSSLKPEEITGGNR